MSQNEELFRPFLLTGTSTEPPTEEQLRLWLELQRPSLRRRPGPRARLRRMVSPLLIPYGDGDSSNWGRVLVMDREPVNQVLTKIAKGLYYQQAREPLPSAVRIIVDHEDDPVRLVIPDVMAGLRRIDVGGSPDIVCYWRAVEPNDARCSMTWVLFYRRKAFRVCCLANELSTVEGG